MAAILVRFLVCPNLVMSYIKLIGTMSTFHVNGNFGVAHGKGVIHARICDPQGPPVYNSSISVHVSKHQFTKM